jgi:phosphomannomutase
MSSRSLPLFELAERCRAHFGTSGVRGLVSDLSDEVCYAYAQAFLRAVGAGARQVAIGHDLRPSSPRIAAACIQAVRDAGCEPVYLGELPTPALAFFSLLESCPGIMVTGSHIPFDRNGIKFYRADGEISKEDEQAILRTTVVLPPQVDALTLPTADRAALQSYVQRYVSFFGKGSLTGCRVAVYEHSSVARDVLRILLEQLGAQVISLGRTDTFVPIDTEAVREEDILQARAWAREHSFDAILSTDGDADRPLIGDSEGNWLRGDFTGILCAQYLGADVVVTPVSSNTAVEKCGAFRQVVRTRIGSPYVLAGMAEAAAAHPEGLVVGYEANGGFLLGGPARVGARTLGALPTRDAVLPMLAVLALSAGRGIDITGLTAALPQRFTYSNRIQNIPSDVSRRLLEQLEADPLRATQMLASGLGCEISRNVVDGLRLTFESGDIIHLRPSGNAPELRCYVESSSELTARFLCEASLRTVSGAISQFE